MIDLNSITHFLEGATKLAAIVAASIFLLLGLRLSRVRAYFRRRRVQREMRKTAPNVRPFPGGKAA